MIFGRISAFGTVVAEAISSLHWFVGGVSKKDNYQVEPLRELLVVRKTFKT